MEVTEPGRVVLGVPYSRLLEDLQPACRRPPGSKAPVPTGLAVRWNKQGSPVACASASEPFELAPVPAGLKSPGHFHRGRKRRPYTARIIGWG